MPCIVHRCNVTNQIIQGDMSPCSPGLIGLVGLVGHITTPFHREGKHRAGINVQRDAPTSDGLKRACAERRVVHLPSTTCLLLLVAGYIIKALHELKSPCCKLVQSSPSQMGIDYKGHFPPDFSQLQGRGTLTMRVICPRLRQI